MSENLLDYTNYDFEDIVLQLQTRLKATDAWKDIYRSSTGSMLIEFLAYILNLTNFFTERRTEESFLPTAQNITSIRNIVSLLGYIPKRKTSAVGNLEFTIPLALSKIVFIPKYIECQSADGLKYVTNESAAIQKGQTSVAVTGIQGELLQKEITSDGAVSQEYLVDDESVENSANATNNTFRVIVDGTEWTLVSSFLNSVNTSQHYRIINENTGKVSVLFGNNISGIAPISGSTILINYIKSDGVSGNVTFNDKITVINDTIYDEDTTVISDIAVTNTSAFLGGDEAEDIEEIRYEAPRVFKTGGRGVNTDDFIAILENFPGVANVNVWGENEEAAAAGVGAVQSMLNKVKMAIVLQEWELPDANFQSVLAAYIYALSMLTVKYEFIQPEILYVIPKMIVKVVTGESLSQAQANIEEVVAAQFLLGSTTKLGSIIKYSSILSAVHVLTDVAYANMTLEIRKGLTITYNSNFDWGELLEAVPVQPETVRIYINDVYVATDVDGGGSGTFSDAGGYIISGSVDYTTGIMNVDISGSPASVYVRYQQSAEGNILPTFRQICKLQEVDILSITIEA